MSTHIQGLRNPRALAQRFMATRGLLGARDADDVLSDAMYGIARAVASWRADGGRSLVGWAWHCMDSEVGRGRSIRARRWDHEVLHDDITDPEWLRARTVDPGYKQVEDRATLQRWADLAHLTDIQADLLAWMAVHHGTRGERRNGQSVGKSLLTDRGGHAHLKAGLAKLRRVAATGQPWVRTSKPPVITPDQARQAVDG